MKEIKRYHEQDYYNGDRILDFPPLSTEDANHIMDGDFLEEHGEWVLYDDHIEYIEELKKEIEELKKSCATCIVLNCSLSCSKDGTGHSSKWRNK